MVLPAMPGPRLGAPGPAGIAHTIPISVCINAADNATEWRAIALSLGAVRKNVFIMCYLWNVSKRARPDIRYPTVSDSQYYFGMMADGTDMVRSLRRTGLPNPEEYRKAKNKYKTWDGPAITEYKRLLAVNARNPLVASKNQVEHARYYHLTELKSRREPEFVVVVSIFMSC
jgi:hypothetical protein